MPPAEIEGHSVDWHGTFIGPDHDPRETGWCDTCGRDVYDGDSGAHDTLTAGV